MSTNYTERDRAYYLANRERINTRSREWSRNNRDKVNAAARKRRKENPEKSREARKRQYWRNPEKWRAQASAKSLMRLYGLSVEDYLTLLSKQGGVCAICGVAPTTRKLAVDHNHDTGKNRGLLCDNCNNGLGRFKDDPTRLRSAASYLGG